MVMVCLCSVDLLMIGLTPYAGHGHSHNMSGVFLVRYHVGLSFSSKS